MQLTRLPGIVAALVVVLVASLGAAPAWGDELPEGHVPVTGYVVSSSYWEGFLEVRAYDADAPYDPERYHRLSDTAGIRSSLPPGRWKIRIFDTDGYFASEWYGDADSFARAPVVTTGATAIDLGRIQVGRGGLIDGFVRDEDGVVARKMQMELLSADGEIVSRWATADNGHYQLGHAAPGRYTVLVSDPYGKRIDPTYGPAEVAVAEGATTPVDDLVVTQLRRPLSPSATVAGRVTDETGAPVQGIWVNPVSFCRSDTQADRGERWAITDVDGRWQIDNYNGPAMGVQVSDGLYWRESEPGVEGWDYAPTFAGSTVCGEQRRFDTPALDVDVVVRRTGALSGGLQFSDATIPTNWYAWLQVFPDGPRQTDALYTGHLSSDEPSMTTPPLPPGRYRLLGTVFDSASHRRTHAGWGTGGRSWDTAEVIEVRPGQVTTISLPVSRELTLTGSPAIYYYGTYPEVGDELEAAPYSKYLGRAVAQSWQWVRDDGLVVSTGTRYTPVPGDAGHRLELIVTVTSETGERLSARGTRTEPVVQPFVWPQPTPTPTPTPSAGPNPFPPPGDATSPVSPSQSPSPTTTVPPSVPPPTTGPSGSQVTSAPAGPTGPVAVETWVQRVSGVQRLKVRVTRDGSPVEGRVRLSARGVRIAANDLSAGRTGFSLKPLPPGRHRLRLTIEPEGADAVTTELVEVVVRHRSRAGATAPGESRRLPLAAPRARLARRARRP